MAIRFFSGSLLFNSSITAKTIAPSLLSRSFSASSAARRFSLIRAISTAAAANRFPNLRPSFTTRSFATRATSSSLNDPSPNWSNRPPKETILLDGCDFEHWLVVMEAPEGNPTRDEIIDSYIKTLAMVVGSEEKARMSIYSVSTRCYYAFGALVSEELSYKIKELPRVRWVLPDSYLDVKNKDYGGEPFINGQAVPYDPKYHEEWIRNNARANERNRRNSDRPKNFDRSRNYERRRENMQRNMQPNPTAYQGMQNSQPAMSGPMDPNNITGVPPPPSRSNYTGGPNNFRGGPPPPPNSYADGPPQQSPNNYMGGQPQNNIGGMQPSNMGGMPQNNMGGVPQNNMGGMPQNMGGMPQNNMGRMPQNNMGGMPQNNMGGMPSTGWSNNMQENMQQNFPNVPNNEGMPYQRAPQNYQNSYNPNRDGSTSGGNN